MGWDGGFFYPGYMCILLYLKHILCSGVPYIYGQLGEGMCVLGISAFFYMLNIFCVVVFHGYNGNWGGYVCPWFMHILQYVKHILCCGVPYIYGQLGEGMSVLDICAFFYV